ncbi:hypothetical protein ABZU32_30980 [Sphaerisporangium sp. NPDC005288]|uniref:hypothetical protein n=1 Tax=Sphaerisporangium sp. NPDC005288 TaxID=3155114 RepID=UPI0033B163C3
MDDERHDPGPGTPVQHTADLVASTELRELIGVPDAAHASDVADPSGAADARSG